MLITALFTLVLCCSVSVLQAQQLQITSCPQNVMYLNVGEDLTLGISYKCTSGCDRGVGVYWRRYNTNSGWSALIYRRAYSGSLTQYDARASLKDDVDLVLSNVKCEDNGTYRVELTANGYTPKPRRLIEVIVKGAPSVKFTNGDDVALDTENFEVICSAGCYPEPTFTLQHNGKTLTTNFNNGVYTIPKVTFSHAGRYTCKATNKHGTTSVNLDLEVKGKPTYARVSFSSGMYLKYKNLEVTCDGHAYPECTYTLYHNGTKLASGSKKVTYTIAEVEYSDAGNYTCVAKNSYGTVSGSYIIQVTDIFNIMPPNPVYVEVGKVLTLHISIPISRDFHDLDLTLKKLDTGKRLSRIHRHFFGHSSLYCDDGRCSASEESGFVFRINNLTFNDSGTYEVELYHRYRYGKTVEVVVGERPVVNIQCDKNVDVSENETIVCHCNTSKGTPTPWLQWYNKDGPIPGAAGYSNKTLSLENIRMEHAGNYTCRAKSGTLTDEKTIVINVLGAETSTESAKCQPNKDQTGKSKSGNSENKWYIIFITLLCGIFLGAAITLVTIKLRHRVRKPKQENNQNAIYEDVNVMPAPTQARNVPPTVHVYHELDVRKMNERDDYQTLRKNVRHGRTNKSVDQNGCHEVENPKGTTE